MDPGLAGLLVQDQTAVLKAVVRFASAPVPPGPPSTLDARRDQSALSNLETIARAIDSARQASGESPVCTNVFWVTSAIYVEATPVFFKTLLEQPDVVGAALN